MTVDDSLAVMGNPRGCNVVVRRGDEDFEYLVLHRDVGGPDYHGLWAWAPPSGSRQHGESVMRAAVDRLRETTGITGADLRPVNFGSNQALWMATVPSDTAVVVGDGFDNYEWLSAAQAVRRCGPSMVSALFNTVDALPDVDVAFRPLHTDDLDILVDWSQREHMQPFFGQALTVETAAEALAPIIDAKTEVNSHLVTIDGAPAGLCQYMTVGDSQVLLAAFGRPAGAVVGDVLLADAELSVDITPQVTWSYIHNVVVADNNIQWLFSTASPDDGAALSRCHGLGFDHGPVMEVAPNTPERVSSLYIPHWFD